MRRAKVAIIALAAAGIVAALIAALVGPLAAPLVQSIGEGRKIWRLGNLELEGVSGPSLGALSAARLRLRDEEGVWAEARNVRIAWRPSALLGGLVDVDAVEAGELEIFRRPKLGPPSADKGPSFDVLLDRLRVARLIVAEPVAGEAAIFTLDGGLEVRDEQVAGASAELSRIDAGGDALSLAYRGAPLELNARLLGPDGGFFAEMFGDDVLAVATADASAARIEGSIGGAEALDARLVWSPSRWTLNAAADLAAAPKLAPFSERFGNEYGVEASGGRPKTQSEPFTASLAADGSTIVVSGALQPGLRVRDPVSVVGEIPAAWASLEGGRLGFDGRVTLSETGASRYEGAIRAQDVRLPGFSLTAAGTADVRMTREAIDVGFGFDDARIAQSEALARLLGGADLEARALWDRQRGALTLKRVEIDSPKAFATAAGTYADGRIALQGDWRVKDASAVTPELRGVAAGGWTATRADETAPYVIDADGHARNLSSPVEALASLMGREGALAARVRVIGDLIAIDRATFNGRNLRVGAQGPIRDNRAELRLEASLRGPVAVSGATLAGAADATGRVFGPLDALSVEARARLDSVALPGVEAQQAVVGLTLSPKRGGGYSGRLDARGFVSGKPAEGEADLILGDDLIAFENASARYAGIDATGRAAFGPAGPDARFDVSGRLEALAPDARGALLGRVSLAPAGRGTSRLDADLRIADARFGPRTRVREARLAASGLLSDIGFTASAAGPQFALSAKGRADLEDGVAARFGLSGSAAGAAIATREEILASARDGETTLTGALGIGDGLARVNWRGTARSINASGTFEALPLAPFAAIGGEVGEGTLSGSFRVQGQGDRLTGDADLAIAGGRLVRRAQDPIDARVRLTLDDRAIAGDVAATSGAGLRASAKGAIPVVASAAPLRIAPAPDRDGTAAWRISGPIDGLWAALGPLDQSLSGVVDGAGNARFGPRGVAGDGALTFSGGRFEDGTTGLTLTDVTARAAFDQNGVTLERFSAGDGAQGRLDGRGRYARDAGGEVRVDLSNVRLLARPEANGRASGSLSLSWDGREAALSGDLRFLEANVSPPRASTAVPTIEVIEVNGPDGLAESDGEPPASAALAPPVRLDVRIRGAERIFTRGRGLNAEWALDLRLQGTLEAPRILGEARLIRGDFDLAGRRFDLERGLIRFTGDPLEAELNLLAVRTAPDLTARVAITGAASDPEIAFSSTPALPEDEVLPQVLFGRSAQELSGFEAAQLAAGLATLAGQASFDIAGVARNAIDLDRLDVREQDGGLLVTGGRYITREVYLEVARGPLGSATTSIEWQVRPRLFLISSFLPEGEQRIAVRWRRDF